MTLIDNELYHDMSMRYEMYILLFTFSQGLLRFLLIIIFVKYMSSIFIQQMLACSVKLTKSR